MHHSTTTSFRARTTGVFAVIALLAAALSPVLAASSAQAVPGYVGVPSGAGGSWPDSSLALMTVGEPYSDSLTAPFNFDDRETWGPRGDVPDGIVFELDGVNRALIHVSGTPTTGGAFEFGIDFGGSDGDVAKIDFAGSVDGGLPSTATSVSTPLPVAPYTAVSLDATVVGSSPTGTVEFFLGGTSVGTSAVVTGHAIYNGAVDVSFVGLTSTLTAVYSGDENNAPSTSDPGALYVYGTTALSGTVTRNGSPVVANVQLLTSSGTPLLSTTSTGGTYTLTLPSPLNIAGATDTYYIVATSGGESIYYGAAGVAGQPNIDVIGDADLVGPAQVPSAKNIYFNDPPVWTDDTLALPHLGSSYSDGVVASGTATLQYAVSAGSLPAGLTLNTATGAITGTPTDQLAYSFTLRAYNTYGEVTKAFTITPGDAGVAPVFTDTVLDVPKVGTAFSSDVAASGDPTISYTSTALPAGLTLNASTGVISGTPTTAGPFTVTITATNSFGHDDYTWAGTIAAAPELSLVLNFAAGTSIDDANSSISADGLKVGSTYTLDLHSDPIRLYTGIVGAGGGFTWVVALPASTPAGSHQLILTGVAPNGTVMTATAWFTLLSNGTIGAVSYTGPFALAFTGADTAASLWLALGLLVAGALALAGQSVRRRAVR